MRRLLPLALPAMLSAMLSALLLLAGLSGPADGAPAPARSAERGQPRAVFFGDSYFVGGGCSPDEKQDMAYLAGTRLGYRTVVRGAGGTGFVAANPEYDLPPYLQQIENGALDVRNPKLVVIAGGSNDLGMPVHKVKRNAIKILRIARAKYPRALLVLVGPMDSYGGYDDSIPIRDGLRTVAGRLHVPFVDDMRWLGGHPDWLCDDYVHPTYAAHAALGRRLAKALARHGA